MSSFVVLANDAALAMSCLLRLLVAHIWCSGMPDSSERLITQHVITFESGCLIVISGHRTRSCCYVLSCQKITFLHLCTCALACSQLQVVELMDRGSLADLRRLFGGAVHVMKSHVEVGEVPYIHARRMQVQKSSAACRYSRLTSHDNGGMFSWKLRIHIAARSRLYSLVIEKQKLFRCLAGPVPWGPQEALQEQTVCHGLQPAALPGPSMWPASQRKFYGGCSICKAGVTSA